MKQDLDELQNTHSSMLQYSDDNSTWIETSLAFEKRPLSREMILALVEKIIVHSNKEISIYLKYQEEYLSTLRYLKMVAHHE